MKGVKQTIGVRFYFVILIVAAYCNIMMLRSISTVSGRDRITVMVEAPLVRNMLRKGLIGPTPANLGIDALPSGSVMGRNGRAPNTLYPTGPPLWGVLWEAIAVPGIRVQAEQLARIIIEGCRRRKGLSPHLQHR